MTDREKAIIMAYTGVTMLAGEKFSIFHKYVEEIMRRPVFTIEFGFRAEEIKNHAKKDFMALCEEYQEERKHGRWYKASPVGIESLKTISKNRDKLLQMRVEDFIRLFSTKPSDEVLARLICIWLKKCDFCVLKGKCYQTAPENMTEHYPTNCISGINEYLESEAEK